MANVFDQFDAPTAPQQTAGNVFDQFDAPQPTIGQRILADLANRQQQGQEIINSDRPIPKKLLQYAGKVGAGGARDIISEGIQSATQGLPQWLKGIPGAVLNAAEAITPKAYDNAAAGLVQQYNNLSPDAKDSLDAAGNFIGLASSLAAPEGMVKTVRAGLNAASNKLASGAIGPADAASDAPEISFGISKHLDNEADKAYKAASGATRLPTATNSFLKRAATPMVQNPTGELVGGGGQDPDLLTTQGPDAAQKYLEEKLMPFMDQPMKISTAQALDQQLRDNVSAAFRAGENNQALRYKAMRQALRDHIFNNPDPSTLTGNPGAFDALQQGNQLFSQARKAEQVENMVQNGMETQVPSTGIQTQFRTLARQIRKNGPMGFKPNEVAAIENAAKTGILTPTLKLMGSRLVTPLIMAGLGALGFGDEGALGGLVGGLAGEAGGNIAGAPFRAGATALQKARALKALQAMVTKTEFEPMADSPPMQQIPGGMPMPGSPKDALDLLRQAKMRMKK